MADEKGENADNASERELNRHESMRQAGGSSNAALFLSLMAIISTVGLIFFAYYSQQQLKALEKATYGEQASVRALVGEAKTAFSELETLKSQHHRQHSALQNLQSELTRAQSKLVTLIGDRNWVISEAGFLISLANQRLHIAQDSGTALAALQTADERLASLSDPSVTELRAALAHDINALTHLPRIDRQGVWQQLTLLQQSLSLLKYQTGLMLTLQPAHQEEISSHLPFWQQALRKSWKDLKSLIQITKLENNPIHPVLNEQMQAELLRALVLQIEQAQWAVLHGENSIYLHNLQNLQKQITDYFVASETQNVILKNLQQLAAVSVEFPKLEINETLKAWVLLTRSLPVLPTPGGEE